MRDNALFFTYVRSRVFAGWMTQSQVDGMNVLLAFWDAKHAADDVRWLAYCLATATHETGRTMLPIAEYDRGQGHPYGVPDPESGQTYYGRGYVQLTWRDNYDRLGSKLGLDLVNHPDSAMLPEVAAQIMFGGMIDGDFSGVGLGHYFNATTDDPVNARRIVNVLDHADEIARTHWLYLRALAPAVPVAASPV